MKITQKRKRQVKSNDYSKKACESSKEEELKYSLPYISTMNHLDKDGYFLIRNFKNLKTKTFVWNQLQTLL